MPHHSAQPPPLARIARAVPGHGVPEGAVVHAQERTAGEAVGDGAVQGAADAEGTQPHRVLPGGRLLPVLRPARRVRGRRGEERLARAPRIDDDHRRIARRPHLGEPLQVVPVEHPVRLRRGQHPLGVHRPDPPAGDPGVVPEDGARRTGRRVRPALVDLEEQPPRASAPKYAAQSPRPFASNNTRSISEGGVQAGVATGGKPAEGGPNDMKPVCSSLPAALIGYVS